MNSTGLFDLNQVNGLGAVTAVIIYICCIFTFVFRLLGLPEVGRWFGVPLLLTAVPLLYLLYTAPRYERAGLYYVQTGLMLAFLLVELMLDYILRADFRHTQWMVIGYVMLFFAGTGGMLGVASLAGRPWSAAAIGLFLIMAVLAFVQRAVTGM